MTAKKGSSQIIDWRVAQIVGGARSTLADERRCLAEITNGFGITASYFSRIFKVQVGVGRRHLFYLKRLELARLLLADPKLSIKEIAFLVGYKHPSDLNHAFRNFHGETPSEYRKRLLLSSLTQMAGH